jgi:hypothetical protein
VKEVRQKEEESKKVLGVATETEGYTDKTSIHFWE